jgi:hypothetical protein
VVEERALETKGPFAEPRPLHSAVEERASRNHARHQATATQRWSSSERSEWIVETTRPYAEGDRLARALERGFETGLAALLNQRGSRRPHRLGG